MESRADLEDLRRSFMPPRVRVLFVGESPPAGGTFFYLGNSTLYRHTREAFCRVYGERVVSSYPSGFLGYFRDRGCYLDDLCSVPVNHLGDAERRRICRASVPSLSRRLATFRPGAVIAVKMTLKGDVYAAMSLAGMSPLPLYVLPHPTFGNQKRYIEGLKECLNLLSTSS